MEPTLIPPTLKRRIAVSAACAAAALGAVLVVLWLRCGLGGCPNVDVLRAWQPGHASQLLDRDGRVFAELSPVEGDTTPLAAVPQHVRDAFLAVEDQRFYEHDGVDWRRVFGAALANVRSGGIAQGSSTFTMQLARNVFPDRLPARQRTFTRKILEMRVAGAIEDAFTKDEILELYLSHIYFGNGARGIDAAARHYFGAPPSKLTLAQGALLAALPKAPTSYDPRRHPKRARKRRDLVLSLMERQGRVDADAAAAARAAPLRLAPRPRAPEKQAGLAPYFVEEVRRLLEEELGPRLYEERLEVRTTLDRRLQTAAEQELRAQLKPQDARLQGAVVALDARSGDVLAWVGGRSFAQSRFDRAKSARRQAGSTFKPFVLAAALEEGRALSEPLDDLPLFVELDRKRTWRPKNYDGRFDGRVGVRDAIVRSKNVPIIRLAQDVGLERVARLARECGIEGEMERTPAMPLGTVAVSPLELAKAYAPFASLGASVAPRFVTTVKGADGKVVWEAPKPEPRRVLDPGTAYLVTDVLRDAVDRGTGRAVRAAGYEGPVAGKTGTTSGATDAWFVGYTPGIVAAVWLGYDEPRGIAKGATGGRLAAPIWARFMARGGRTAAGWQRPEEVVERLADPHSGEVLGEGCRTSTGRAVRELFLARHLPDEECPSRGEAALAERTIWELDDESGWLDEWPGDLAPSRKSAPQAEREEIEWIGPSPQGDDVEGSTPGAGPSGAREVQRVHERVREEASRQRQQAREIEEDLGFPATDDEDWSWD